MEYTTNQIQLCGNLHSPPEFSHKNHDKEFYRFMLEVPRLSGTLDQLPVIIEKNLLLSVDISSGTMIRINGQIRSHNIRTDGKRHLMIFVFADNILCEDNEAINTCFLSGPICREPIYRRTPLGREICDVMLAVPRSFRRADYLPCIFWGKTARDVSALHTRDLLQIQGRLQSRQYTKNTDTGTETRIAYEISVLTAEMQSV